MAIIYLVQCQSTSWDFPEVAKSLAFKAAMRQLEQDAEKTDDFGINSGAITGTMPSTSYALSGTLGSTLEDGGIKKTQSRDEKQGHKHSDSDATAVEMLVEDAKLDELHYQETSNGH